jgi:hypothetical protein
MRLQTGGLVPRRVTLMTYTSTRVWPFQAIASIHAKNLAKERIDFSFLPESAQLLLAESS